MFLRTAFLCLIAATQFSFAANTRGLGDQLKSIQESPDIGSISSSQKIDEIIEVWAKVPPAFQTCRSTIQSGVSVELAVQAVQKLYQDVKVVLSYTSGDRSSAQAEHVNQFKHIVVNYFMHWNQIILIAEKRYTSNLNLKFTSAFQPFQELVSATKSACSLFPIDLNALLGGIGLRLDVFLSININLHSLLNLSIGLDGL